MNRLPVSRLKIQAISLALSSVACDGAGPVPSEPKIFGGKASAQGDWASAVALERQGRLFCSGVAVSPRLVLTAAHCLKDKPIDAIKIYSGEGSDDAPVNGSYAIQSFAISPRYTVWDFEETSDFAFIVLDRDLDIPSDAYLKILDASTAQELLKEGALLKVVGYGRRDGHRGGSKWEVDVPLTRRTANEIHLGGKGQDSCEGDSGGPAYVQIDSGEWRLAALTVGGADCGDGGRYQLVHSQLPWLEENPDSKELLSPADR